MERRKNNPTSLWALFWEFTKIGAFTIGGGYMMVPAMQDAVSRKGWLRDEELTDIVAISQSAPGLLAVNMSIFTGYRLRGAKGSVAAAAGSVIAPFLIILIIAMMFTNFQENHYVQAFFNGVRPASVGIIAAYGIKLSRYNKTRWWAWAITVCTLVLIIFLRVSPIYILLTLIIFSLAIAWWRQEKK